MDGTFSIRRLRRAAGLTQAELATRAGIARETWQRIECGRLNPTADEAMGIARALGISPDGIEKSLRIMGNRIWKGTEKGGAG